MVNSKLFSQKCWIQSLNLQNSELAGEQWDQSKESAVEVFHRKWLKELKLKHKSLSLIKLRSLEVEKERRSDELHLRMDGDGVISNEKRFF